MQEDVGIEAIDYSAESAVKIAKGTKITVDVIVLIEKILENTIKNGVDFVKGVNGKNNLKKLQKSGEPLACFEVNEADVNLLMAHCNKANLLVAPIKIGDTNIVMYSQKDMAFVSKAIEIIARERLGKEQEQNEQNKDVDEVINDNSEIEKHVSDNLEHSYEQVDNKSFSTIKIDESKANELIEKCSEIGIEVSPFEKNDVSYVVVKQSEKDLVKNIVEKLELNNIEPVKDEIDHSYDDQQYFDYSQEQIPYEDVPYDYDMPSFEPDISHSIPKDEPINKPIQKEKQLNNKKAKEHKSSDALIYKIDKKDLEELKVNCENFNIDISKFENDGNLYVVVNGDDKSLFEKVAKSTTDKRQERESIDYQVKNSYKEVALEDIDADKAVYNIKAEKEKVKKDKGPIEKNIEASKEKSKNSHSHTKDKTKTIATKTNQR